MSLEIQPGWTVVDANGIDLGTVIGVDGPMIRVKKGGFLGGEIDVPADTVSEVETGRVELRVAREDLS